MRIDHGKPKTREIREHGFGGAQIAAMWQDALHVSAKKVGNDLEVILKNDLPHNLPSGFGSREILVEIAYTKSGKIISNSTISLSRHYLNKYNTPTFAHTAEKYTADISVPAKGEKNIKVKLNKDVTGAIVTVSYRLVNDEVRGLLELKEPIWSQKMPIAKVSVNF